MLKSKHSTLFVFMVALSVTAMLISNIGAFKQVVFFGTSIPGGSMVFIITYVLSDVFSEVYGYKASRFISNVGLGLNAFAVLIFQITIWQPAPAWFEGSEAFATVLGSTFRTWAAGAIAYYVGDFMNDRVFQYFRAKDGVGHRFALRAILSSAIGELFDSTIFTVLAFWGLWPVSEMASSIIALVIAKTGYEVIILPITTIITRKVKKYEASLLEVSEVTNG